MTFIAPIPENEPERLARLHALHVLDTGPEPMFDLLAQLASEICQAPIALVSLVDWDRQWFKANVGLPAIQETPRDVAFCAHAILGSDILEIPDARLDWRFADNPVVTGDPHIRFYAGAPIIISDGFRLGTLCVIDKVPKKLFEQQLSLLRKLATLVAQALEFRERAIGALTAVGDSQKTLETLYTATPAMMQSLDEQGNLLTVSDLWLEELGYTRREVIGRSFFDFLSEPSRQAGINVTLPRFQREERIDNVEGQMVRKDGSRIDVSISAILEHTEDGKPRRALGVVSNVTLRRQAERALIASEGRYRALVEDQTELVCLISPDDRLTFVNPAFASFVGQESRKLLGTCIADQATINSPIGSDLIEKARKSREVVHGVSTVRSPDDKTRWIAWTLRAVLDAKDGVVAIHAVGRDTTDYNNALEELRASQSFLKRTGLIAGVGGWEVNLINGALSWSEETCRFHGVPTGYHPSLDEALSHYPDGARSELVEAIEGAINHGIPWDLELPFISAEGHAMWVRVAGMVEWDSGKPIRMVGALQDVTQRKRMEQELAANRQMLQVTLESIADAVITTNVSDEVQWMNPIAERLTGWTKEEAQGAPLKRVFVLVGEKNPEAAPRAAGACPQRDCETPFAGAALISRDGHEYGIEQSVSAIRDSEGEVHGTVLVFRDVTEQRRLSTEISHHATHDVLTGLPNRREFEKRLERLLDRAQAERSRHGLMFIDLDRFKPVNDMCGHAVGDQLLQQISTLLQGCVRSADTAARLGGDEFGILLDHCDLDQAKVIAQNICDQIANFHFQHDGRAFRIGASIGLVPLDSRWNSIPALLQAADTSCYAAKEAGRNQVHTWFETEQAMAIRRGDAQWAQRLEHALKHDHFALYAQRITPLATQGPGHAYEILLRLQENPNNVIAPGAFFPAVERFRLATRIDRWVVCHALDWLEDRIRAGERIEMMTINLSAQSIGDRTFHRDLTTIVKQSSIDASKLCFEISENTALGNLADTKTLVEDLRCLGTKVALDDFGSGASSFGYIRTLPVDFIKIDGRFVTNMLDDQLDYAAVKWFREIARIMSVETIAECVETEAVRASLLEIGIDRMQGFLIHQPQPLDCL